MPLVIPVGGYAQVKFRYRLVSDPEEMIWTCGFKATDYAEGDNHTDVASVAKAAAIAHKIAMAPGFMLNIWTFVGCQATMRLDTTTPGLDIETAEHDVNVLGTTSGISPVNNTAVLIKKQTSYAGRANTGRAFWPPFFLLREEIDSRGTLRPDLMTGWQTVVDDLEDNLRAGQQDGAAYPGGLPKLEPVILHSNADNAPTPVTRLVLQPRAATQRRRMRP
jgi:hypothetical protein